MANNFVSWLLNENGASVGSGSSVGGSNEEFTRPSPAHASALRLNSIRRGLFFLVPVLGLLLSGCGGGTSSQGPPPPSPDFAISVSPAILSTPLGLTTAPVTVSVTAQNGFVGSVSVTISGLPQDATSSPAFPFNVNAGSTQPVTFSFPTSLAPGPVNVAFQAISGSLSHSAQLSLTTTTPLANITVDAAAVGAQIQPDAFGANMSVGFDVTKPPTQGSLLASIGIKIVRWPGGIPSDLYHWQTNTWSVNACGFFGPGPIIPPPANSGIDSFIQNFVIPNHLDVAITLNYGTNATCDGPADPNEAIAWVDYANNQKHYGIHYWTIGNEVYFPTEPDLHPMPHDPTTYANEVANQIYPGIKAKDPMAQVGVVVTGIQGPANWDPIVLGNAKYDFVEIHFYPEVTGQESDAFLLTQAPQQFDQTISKVRQELSAAGRADTPIIVGEFNSVNNNPGKQSVSIVNGLYMGVALGELLNAGLPIATMQTGFSSCGVGNQSASLYGWQNFGSYNLFSQGTPTAMAVPGCPNAQTTAFGTPFPSARAYQLATMFAHASEHILATSLYQVPNVRAYAASRGTGYALFLFNLDENNPIMLTIAIGNTSHSAFTGQASTYDKALYDQTQNGNWVGPTSVSLEALNSQFSLTLPPWSMTAVQLAP